MKFTKQDLIDGLDNDTSPGKTVVTELVGRGRWDLRYRRVFEFDGKFYETFYSVGATENQDFTPYDWAETFECEEVFPERVSITVYKKKS